MAQYRLVHLCVLTSLVVVLFTNIYFSLRHATTLCRRVDSKFATSHNLETKELFVPVQSWNIGLQKNNQASQTTGLRNERKLILAYTTVYGMPWSLKDYEKTTCKYECQWSSDKSDYNRSDAAMFHMYNNFGNKDIVINKLPNRRSPDQKWVLMVREPQAFFQPQQLKLLNKLFNLSVSFQTDSDITIPYGQMWPLPASLQKQRANVHPDYLSGKDKMVAMLVSNCVTSSRREEYVKELRKHTNVDVYGKCTNLKGEEGKRSTVTRDMLAKQYKFYLALENSDCDDYITEKFWINLQNGMIPIVRGHRSRYEKVAPPGSYIHADSFLTPKHLAEHLNTISANSTLFHQYHEWRRKFQVGYRYYTTNIEWMCEICTKVHTAPRQTVDVYKHFSETSRCFNYLDHDGRDRTGERIENLEQ